jgi:SAM-dependent methyltransferase
MMKSRTTRAIFIGIGSALGAAVAGGVVLRYAQKRRERSKGTLPAGRDPSVPNLAIYRWYAPVYDRLFGPLLQACRRQSVQWLALCPGERLLISGVGTGLDLPLIDANVRVTGVDISLDMLRQAAQKRSAAQVELRQMDAQALELPAESYDAVLLNLILSVAPDGTQVLKEAWRMLRPGGRIVIFDKFLPEEQAMSAGRAALGVLIRLAGTDPNRRISEMLAQVPGAEVIRNQPSIFQGQYRLILLRKPG